MVRGGGPGTGLQEAMRVWILPPTVGVAPGSQPSITSESSAVQGGRTGIGGLAQLDLRTGRTQVTGESDSQSPDTIISLCTVFLLPHLRVVRAGRTASDPRMTNRSVHPELVTRAGRCFDHTAVFTDEPCRTGPAELTVRGPRRR